MCRNRPNIAALGGFFGATIDHYALFAGSRPRGRSRDDYVRHQRENRRRDRPQRELAPVV
jgi:hypothetical protein